MRSRTGGYFAAPLLFIAAFSMVQGAASEGFWVTAELIAVDWKDACLTTAGCASPRFQITQEIASINERVSISWPVVEQPESPRQFVAHWTRGSVEEVQIGAQTAGKDHVYGFPRVCDGTQSEFPFKKDADIFGRYRRHRDDSRVTVDGLPEDGSKKIIELRARCFNASIAVQKHTERCPWCPDPAALSVIANELPEENAIARASALFGLSDSQLMHAGLIGLGGFTVIVTILLIWVAVAYCRQKKSLNRRSVVSVKPRHHFIYTKPPGVPDFEDRRYDAPWEQAVSGRPLTYGLFSAHSSSKGSGDTHTTTSPLDSSSTIGFGGTYRGLVPPPSTRIYHQIGSPNGSHDDSGLESV